MAKRKPSEARLLQQAAADIAEMLPPTWSLYTVAEAGRGRPDFTMRFVGPDGSEGTVIVEAKRSLNRGDVPSVLRQLRAYAESDQSADIALAVTAPYLSESSRELIEAEGANYFDSTGNVLLELHRPSLFIRTTGANRDPWPSDDALRSLKGRGTGRALRAILDFVPPFGVRELATRAGVPLGSLSRTIDFLNREGLIERVGRKPVTDVDWPGVIRRWARDYGISSSNQIATYLDPRGLSSVTGKLEGRKRGFAATGAIASQRFAPIAPTRLAAVYVNDVSRWAARLDLREADAGANVWLIEPYDDVVFERTVTRDGLVCVNPSQLAVDLLTGPGRDPAEGEELLTWMERNQDAWRTR